MTIYNLISFVGIFGILAFAWIFSSNRKILNFRLIFWGISIQLVIAALVFTTPGVSIVFKWLNDLFIAILGCANEGIEFVFGSLAYPEGVVKNGHGSLGFILAIQGLCTIIFFSALISLLYYFKIIDFFIKLFARMFTSLMKISGAESLCASSNIFVGIESFLVVRPYIKRMTKSEILTIMTAGLSTVASSVLGLYVLLLSKQIPNVAGHLMSASIISAPAAIVLSKIVMPETDKPVTLGQNVDIIDADKSSNFIEAIINGANQGAKMIINVIALLIAFIGIVALLNLIVSSSGDIVNHIFNTDFTWSIERFIGYLFTPIALMMGIPPDEVVNAGLILGQRSILTEVKGFQSLAEYTEMGLLSHRSQVILSYALTGFAHIASVAIFVGGAISIVPERKKEFALLGLRALFTATLACCLTGAVAGVFYH